MTLARDVSYTPIGESLSDEEWAKIRSTCDFDPTKLNQALMLIEYSLQAYANKQDLLLLWSLFESAAGFGKVITACDRRPLSRDTVVHIANYSDEARQWSFKGDVRRLLRLRNEAEHLARSLYPLVKGMGAKRKKRGPDSSRLLNLVYGLNHVVGTCTGRSRLSRSANDHPGKFNAGKFNDTDFVTVVVSIARSRAGESKPSASMIERAMKSVIAAHRRETKEEHHDSL